MRPGPGTATAVGGLCVVAVLVASSALGTRADEVLTGAVLPMGFYAMGAVAATLRPEHRVGHGLLAVGLLHMLAVLGAAAAAMVEPRVGSSLLGAASALLFVTGFVAVLDLLVRFPDGRDGWPWVRPLVLGALAASWLAWLLGVLGSAETPNVLGLAMPANPFHVDALTPLAGVSLAALALPLVGLVLLVGRYRGGSEQDRRQMAWPIAAALLLAVGLATTGLLESLLGPAVQTAVFIAVALVFPASFLVGLLRHSEEAERVAELEASRERVARAAAEERRRIERDLHDGAQQHLIALLSQVELARVNAGHTALDQDLDRIADGIKHAHRELRTLAHGIHPAVLTDHGLAEAVRSALARMDGEPRLQVADDVARSRYPEQVEVTTYFVVLEALTNAAKHAPGAQVEVRLDERDGALRVTVHDAGPGLDASVDGFGLTGIADRLAAHGGTLDVHSVPGGGTTLTATVPVGAVDDRR